MSSEITVEEKPCCNYAIAEMQKCEPANLLTNEVDVNKNKPAAKRMLQICLQKRAEGNCRFSDLLESAISTGQEFTST